MPGARLNHAQCYWKEESSTADHSLTIEELENHQERKLYNTATPVSNPKVHQDGVETVEKTMRNSRKDA